MVFGQFLIHLHKFRYAPRLGSICSRTGLKAASVHSGLIKVTQKKVSDVTHGKCLI